MTFATELIAVLQELYDYYQFHADFMRAKAFKTAVEAIEGMVREPTSPADLKGVKGIGGGIMKKAEIVFEGKLPKEVAMAREDPARVFAGIHGIGGKKAKSLVEKGITSLEMLREHADELTDAQRIGLRYMDDFAQRIPRAEIDVHRERMAVVLDPLEVTWEIVGSQRRGATESGDIDVIVNSGGRKDISLPKIIEMMRESGYITDVLSLGRKKFLGVSRVGSLARRLDVLLCPPEEYWFSVLYFTGSKGFNIGMRARALEQGYTLNEHGVSHMEGGVKTSMLKLTPGSERDIFDFFNMEQVEPNERTGASAVITKNAAAAGGGGRFADLVHRWGLSEELSQNDAVDLQRHASDRYHNAGAPVMTDAAFDRLGEYIEDRWPTEGVTAEIGAAPSADAVKARLPVPMPSLDKLKPGRGDFEGWVEKQRSSNFVVSDKLDGISLLLQKTGGKLRLYTRGDGTTGTDVTRVLGYIGGIPDIDELPEECMVRGEAIIRRDEQAASEFAAESKLIRSFVAGAVGAKTLRPAKLRLVRFVAQELVQPRHTAAVGWEMLGLLGFETAWHETVDGRALTMDQMKETFQTRRDASPYDVDGVVMTAAHLKVDTPAELANPAHSVAFKMVVDDQLAETTVVAVEWNVSRHRYLKPTVRVKPVALGGKTVSSATGKNARFIIDNGIGVGARVRIENSGEVIPNVHSVITRVAPTLPEVYEWRGEADIALPDDVDSAEHKKAAIAAFFAAVGLDGISAATLGRIYDAGLAREIPEFFHLTRDGLLDMPRTGAKTADKILEGMRLVHEKLNPIVVAAASGKLGRGIGKSVVESVFRRYPDALKRPLRATHIQSIAGIGETRAAQIAEGLPALVEFIRSIKPEMLEAPAYVAPPPVEGPLAGNVYAFSGGRDHELEVAVILKGGAIATSLTKNVTHLVVADKSAHSSKMATAEKRGIPIITREELQRETQ